MATSTIPAFKAAVVARLTADGALGAATPPVHIAYGLPHTGLERDAVLVGNTRGDDPTDASQYPGGQTGRIGHGTTPEREERYVLECVVTVTRAFREPQQTVTERGFTIAAAIENSLRAWQVEATPYSGIVRWAQVTALYHVEGTGTQTDGNGIPVERGSRVFIDIACSARI